MEKESGLALNATFLTRKPQTLLTTLKLNTLSSVYHVTYVPLLSQHQVIWRSTWNTNILGYYCKRCLIENKVSLKPILLSQIQMMLFGVWLRVCPRASLLAQCALTQVETSVQCMNTWRASTPSRLATPAPSVLEGSALLSMPCALILSATTVLPEDLSPNKASSKHGNAIENWFVKVLLGQKGILKYFWATCFSIYQVLWNFWKHSVGLNLCGRYAARLHSEGCHLYLLCMKNFSLQPWLMLRSSKIRWQADGAVVIASSCPSTRPTWGTT